MTVLASKGQLRASLLRWSLFTVPLCLLLGFLAGRLAGPDSVWFAGLVKPGIYPDPRVFGIVWSVLYLMIGFALALVCAAWGARGRTAALIVFALHFALNLSWTTVFFGMHQITGGLVVLGAVAVTLVAVIVLFWRVRTLAGVLLLPYLAWVCFASVLNYQFLQLNPAADGKDPNLAVERYAI